MDKPTCQKCLDKKVIVYGEETISGQESVKCECKDEIKQKEINLDKGVFHLYY